MHGWRFNSNQVSSLIAPESTLSHEYSKAAFVALTKDFEFR